MAGHKKARLWIEGRKNPEARATFNRKSGRTYWFHCSSLGEFEQGRPLIEALRVKEPEANIVLSFFSPSGYEIRKNYSIVDCVLYLPLDGKKNAKHFIDTIKPDIVFFIKYDYWYYYLETLKEKNISVYIVSAIFRKDQHFFTWYGSFFKKMLDNITHFFLQDNSSAELLQKIGLNNYTVSGDTRFDRVTENSKTISPISVLDKFTSDSITLVCGSTWPTDEELLIKVFHRLNNPRLKLIIAPHDIDKKRIEGLEKSASQNLKKSEVLLFSKADDEKMSECRILVLDTMGQLSTVYSYGNLAYVGGGFGKGIHNTLEPAAFGIPIIFGPKHQKFREATGLIESGAAFSISSENELALIIDTLIKQKTLMAGAGNAADEYVKSNSGATRAILLKLNL
jgi:3-deoxy-D-manno-octulosonic-acid transferase